MLTNDMILASYADAHTWAENMGDFSCARVNRLARWIWANAPDVNTRYADHPVKLLNLEEFWDILDGE